MPIHSSSHLFHTAHCLPKNSSAHLITLRTACLYTLPLIYCTLFGAWLHCSVNCLPILFRLFIAHCELPAIKSSSHLLHIAHCLPILCSAHLITLRTVCLYTFSLIYYTLRTACLYTVPLIYCTLRSACLYTAPLI